MSRQDRLAAAAAAAAKRRQEQRRVAAIIGAVVVVVVALIVVGIGSIGGGGGHRKTVAVGAPSTTSAASVATTAPATGSTTVTTASGSAAGKPCVAVSDPLPKGAPPVPVKLGPPPAQLVMQDIKAGTGAAVTASATITVNYIGVACSTGKVFDSSYATGAPATFPLTGVIKGWQDGIPGMKVGGQRVLGIPPAQAYGSQGQPPIAPGETLWFVIELLKIA